MMGREQRGRRAVRCRRGWAGGVGGLEPWLPPCACARVTDRRVPEVHSM